ncbi:monocarboxylate transporter 12-like [Mercenaria mercenaria]|uniref:monocarboxylate transporter 12-like n=1 Tax=Mercenaria mercenaria TaxID=6596 RepID=UPI00234F88C0|nr:monocarboxylate transporter 12-like [Mercenaria mercenaria]XP_053403428.1 monocarboxylate transporter 12-like [Mercenaria mercenaria]XP_053403429.1 monocarboxylate transporter 12-like [Mercenaria mercenaria]
MTNKQVKMKPTVRDRGYAWVIVVAAFFLQAIQDGVRFSYGLYFVEFLNEFNKGKGQTAWVGSIMLSVFNLGGPISAYIVNRFGYRIGTMAGSLITTVAFLLSYFTPNLYYLYFTFGALQGFGFGMVFLSGYVATGKYFKKRRALAVGITFCGGGIGTFVFLPVARLIIDTFGWRGSMFILAGVTLNECVCASLLRPFVEGDAEVNEAEVEEDSKNKQQTHTNQEVSDGNAETAQSIPLLPMTTDIDAETGSSVSKSNEHPVCSRSFPDVRSVNVCPDTTETRYCGSNRSLNMTIITNSANKDRTSSTHIAGCDARTENDTSVPLTHDKDTCNMESRELNGKTKNDKFKNTFIENLFPKELVTNSNFIVLMLSTVFIAIPEFVPYSMLPDFALTVKCSSSQSAWMLSAVGIGATISQVGAGWLADMKCVHNLSLLGGSILSIGVTTMIVTVIPMFETLITYSVMYGMLSGAMYSVQPIVLLEYIDEKHMATMHGLTMWVYGISGLIGSPAAGWLFDATGNYTLSFLAAGACFVVSGSVNFLVLVTRRSRKARQRKKQKSET